MTNEIKQKIEQIKKGEVPEGYCYSRAGFSPNDWEKGILADVLYNEQRSVEKPKEPYWRVGIKSHAKGTFHEYVENPDTVDMDELYVVRENDLIINITFAWEHAVALADKNDDGLLVSHRFPTYVFKEGQNPVFFKSVIIQKRFKELLALISPGGAGRNRVMSKKDFLHLPCNIPPFAEQQKIAEILMECDKVIELKQKLIDETKKLKKAFLSKMFPQKGENTPEIRFPGFTASWEQRRLGELVHFSKGTGYSKNDLKDSGTPIILYGRLYTKYETVISDVDTFTIEKAKSVYSHGGEVIVPASGETAEDISIASVVEKSGVLLGGDLNIITSPSNIDPVFLAISISNGKPHEDMAKMAQGKSVVHLHNTDLEKIDLIYPSYAEQLQISSYFKNIDTLITLHQRELQEWQNKKRALMQLLLTGIVRVTPCQKNKLK